MPRFVLLYHDCSATGGPASHWDLMLERDGALLTWRLPALPAPWGGTLAPEAAAASCEVAATRLPDHRTAYLDYEGPVSGGRGAVSRVDGGEYVVVSESAAWLEAKLVGAAGTACWRLPMAVPGA